jgi:hypothetical protein
MMNVSLVSAMTVVALLALPKHPAVAAQAACDPAHLEGLYIVDAHSHFFNLDYLPEKGMLYRYGVPWPVAGLVAALLHGATPTIDPDGTAAPAASLDLGLLDALDEQQLKAYLSDELLDGEPTALFFLKMFKPSLRSALVRQRLFEAVAADPSLKADEARKEAKEQDIRGQYDGRSTPELVLELTYLTLMRGDDDADSLYSDADASATKERVRGAMRTLKLLMSPESAIVDQAAKDFPQVDLFVHHMMDMERPYDDRPPLEFEGQIRHARWLNDHYNAKPAPSPGPKLAFFVAYDPFRRDADLVWEGEGQGARGIKFYPPSGYRPADTVVPEEPKRTFPVTASHAQRKQWDARYDGWDEAAIDEQNQAVFQEAVTRSLPIFSHQNDSGFAVGDTWGQVDYGELMGAPCHWQRLLDTMDPPPTVILAHAGGTGAWFNEHSDGWSERYALQAYNLCVSYPTVYCDFGGASRILEEDERLEFVDRLEHLTGLKANAPSGHAPGDLCARTTEVSYRKYELEDKILYGSDWLVSLEDDREDYLCRFGEAFKPNTPLGKHRQKFFGGNAKAAFGLP